ncbi:hypothetical protein L6452_46617 [Arctium lappa]|nr:hypothetical protein L6452_46617 [Arctium lappa]
MGIVLQGGPHDSSVARAWPTTRAFGGRGPYCWSANRRRATRVASSPDSDLEAFSHNPAHGSFAPLAFQPAPMTKCANQRSSRTRLNYYCDTVISRSTGQKSHCVSIRRDHRNALGCSPWRPDAVMSTTGRGRHSVLRIFKGPPGAHRTPRATCGALPAAGPYLRLSRFQGGQAVKQKRYSSRGPPPTSPDSLTLPSAATSRLARSLHRNRLPVHPASPVLLTKNGPLGALDSVARLNEAAPRRIVHHLSGPDMACSHSNPSQKIKVGRGAPHEGDPANQLPCALRVYSPVDSHTCHDSLACFKTGRMGCPQAGAGSTQVPRHAVTARAANHDRRDGISTGISTARALAAAPIRTGPRPESIGGPALAVPHPTGTHRRPPSASLPDNFKHSLTLFSKSFHLSLAVLGLLSVSRRYLALDGIYRPIGAAFPNNPTRRQRLVVRQGPGTTGLSPSPAPPSRGLGARSAAEDASPDYNLGRRGRPIFKLGLVPGSLAVTKGILRRCKTTRWGHWRALPLRPHRLDTKALTTTTSRASVKGDSFLGQPHHGHGRPVSAPNDTHPHWGGVVGGDAMRDAPGRRALGRMASGATCVQKLDGSRDSAIHTKYRILLRSSSMREPRYPLPRDVYV